jgi:hypothetical protein
MNDIDVDSTTVNLLSELDTRLTPEGKTRNVWVKKHRGRVLSWEFTLEYDFEDIIQSLGSVSMSREAKNRIGEYMDEKNSILRRQKAERYMDVKESDFPWLKEDKISLFIPQKEAIDFILNKGNGLVGLDTGMGKTLVGVCIIMKWITDGTLDKRNGKVLIVADKSLIGNFANQIEGFCTDPDKVMSHIDMITYQGFRKGQILGAPFSASGKDYDAIENYGAVMFDEAQALNGTPKGGEKPNQAKTAHMLDHPHKVLMTASIMEKSPRDLFNLVSIANNEDPDTLTSRWKQFAKEYCVMAGQRVAGIKQDPESKKALARWVRTNAVSLSKTENRQMVDGEVRDVPLPRFNQHESVVSMDDELQKLYMDVAEPILSTIYKMMKKYGEMAKDQAFLQSEGYAVLDEILRAGKNKKSDINEYQTVMRKLQLLSTAPEVLASQYPDDPRFAGLENLPKERNTKLMFVLDKITKEPNKKFILWTDTPSVAEFYGKKLSEEFPSREIGVALAGEILVWESGKVIKRYHERGITELNPEYGRVKGARKKKVFTWQEFGIGDTKKNEDWQVDALRILKNDLSVLVLTSAYTKGHNLQAFTRTIHLDRDSFNNENMKQRDGRNWRTPGFADIDKPADYFEAIDSYIPDTVLGGDLGERDVAIDTIRKYMMNIEDALFNAVVRESFAYRSDDQLFDVDFETVTKKHIERKVDELQILFEDMTKKTFSRIFAPGRRQAMD